MMLSYSFRVLFANFSNMWKVLLYRLIVLILTLSLAAGLMLPTLNGLFGLIKDTGIFTHITDFVSGIFTGTIGSINYADIFKNDLINISNLLIEQMGKLVLSYVFIIICMCFSRFLNGIADYALTDVINSSMCASAKFGFTGAVIRNLRKGTRFSLARMLFTIPFDVAIGTLLVYMFIALFSPLGFFMPFFVMLTAIGLISFRATLFSGWLPAVVADGDPVFQGLRRGVKAVFSRFGKVFSSWVFLLFIIIFVGSLLVLFTCGVGVIVVIPTVILLTVIFYLVMYYGAMGRRYYIDHETIVTPKTLHDREQAVSYEVRNNVFFDNTNVDLDGETPEKEDDKHNH